MMMGRAIENYSIIYEKIIMLFLFCRTFNIWNQSNSHPLFAESDARYHAISLAKMRKVLYMVTGLTTGACVGMSSKDLDFYFCLCLQLYLYWLWNSTFSAWTTITFFGESVKGSFNKETNETEYIEVPRLPIKSFYPWDAMSGMAYMGSFVFQVKWT